MSTSNTATALSLLLREDPLLTIHNLTTLPSTSSTTTSTTTTTTLNANEEAAFSYAAALLHDDATGWMSPPTDVQSRAAEALAEADRKLMLVQSLYERVARESPAAVAGPLLRLHGYKATTSTAGEGDDGDEEEDGADGMTAVGSHAAAATTAGEDNAEGASLAATRDRCDRLRRQGDVLEGVAKRVENSLTRGLRRMEAATLRLSRVLELSGTLKMAMRLCFEAKKIQGSGIDFAAFLSEEEGGSSHQNGKSDGGRSSYYAVHNMVDLRDLTRAAASVAAMEQLLSHPSLDGSIAIVEQIRPEAQNVALAVRRAAAGLLSDQHHSDVSQLGATLQVYFHLGELPQAVWGAVTEALARAEKANSVFFSPANLQRIQEMAMAEAKAALEGSGGGGGALERELKKKVREKRAESAARWSAGVIDAAMKVWNLHRVLKRKSDPVTRQNFGEVFSAAPIPELFAAGERLVAKADRNDGVVNLFPLYWNQACVTLGLRIQRLLKYDNASIASDVAALYPAVRSAALGAVGSLNDAMRAASGGDGEETATSVSTVGIMGGWGSSNGGYVGADSWTQEGLFADLEEEGASTEALSVTAHLSSTTSCTEWKALCGSGTTGLNPLKRAFLEFSFERLTLPLQYLFPEAVTVDEEGVAIPCLPTIPSRFELAKLDAAMREELSCADPRAGGGELGMVSMMCGNIVKMVIEFCQGARTATSNSGEDNYLRKDLNPTEGLKHDQKLIVAFNTLSAFLRNAPDKTFIAPYRPAQLPQHEEAARTAQISLLPALAELQTLVKTSILTPLCRGMNKRLSATIAKMHQGTYLDGTHTEETFVQTHLVGIFETIADRHLTKLPNEYGAILASTVATFTIYAFVSNVSLVRPMGETGRLRITQDLADLELALEQFVIKAGGTTTLSQLDRERPYLELRAVRQMLFFEGFENPAATPQDITKSLLREMWMKDVRPSTVFHFLISFAPALLSSPHHMKRVTVEDYVKQLVSMDGGVEEGEASAWMVTMACCDAYQQRETVLIGDDTVEGDRRVANVLMIVGPELLRRRRQ